MLFQNYEKKPIIIQNIRFCSVKQNQVANKISMPFFTLRHYQKTIAIKNKKRISLIVGYKSTELVIFYQDCSYQHREVFTNNILHEGKLSFMVMELVNPDKSSIKQAQYHNKMHNLQYLLLLGKKDQTNYFGILNIESSLYQPYQQIFFQSKTEIEKSIYQTIVHPRSEYPLLIEITQNIENGIMIKCFNFKTLTWVNDILYLGLKFLNSFFVTVPKGLVGGQDCNFFSLVSNGDKSDSVHIVCISIKQEQTSQLNFTPEVQSLESLSFQEKKKDEALQKKHIMQLVFTKQIKYQKNFTVLGGHITNDGYLCLVFLGNSISLETSTTKDNKTATLKYLYLNFVNLLNFNDCNYQFVEGKLLHPSKEIIVRSYLGYFQQSMIFILESPSKRTIHKVCPQNLISKSQCFQEQLYVLNQTKMVYPSISLDGNSLLYYELVCQQFFEKIKDSPSVIKLNYLQKLNKKIYFKEMIENFFQFAKKNENFTRLVISML